MSFSALPNIERSSHACYALLPAPVYFPTYSPQFFNHACMTHASALVALPSPVCRRLGTCMQFPFAHPCTCPSHGPGLTSSLGARMHACAQSWLQYGPHAPAGPLSHAHCAHHRPCTYTHAAAAHVHRYFRRPACCRRHSLPFPPSLPGQLPSTVGSCRFRDDCWHRQ